MPSPFYKLVDQRAAALAQQLINVSSQQKTVNNQQANTYTPSRGDNGLILSSLAANVFINTSVFNPGDIFYVHNSSSANTLTITPNTGVTIYAAGASVTAAPLTGNRFLAPKGFATLNCVGANTFVITTGSGVF